MVKIYSADATKNSNEKVISYSNARNRLANHVQVEDYIT